MELGRSLELNQSSTLNISLAPEDCSDISANRWVQCNFDGIKVGDRPGLHGKVFVSTFAFEAMGDHARILERLGLDSEVTMAIFNPAAQNLEIFLSSIDNDTLTGCPGMSVKVMPEYMLTRTNCGYTQSDRYKDMGIEQIAITLRRD